jgi:hypothetical protein
MAGGWSLRGRQSGGSKRGEQVSAMHGSNYIDSQGTGA